MNEFWLCFVPIFVAVDPIGVVPLFFSLTEGCTARERHHIILTSVLTAGVVAVGFVLGGQVLLHLLGVTIPDFMVAGGVLLFLLSLSDVMTGEKRRRRDDTIGLGAVPLGVPLIAGPGTLTAALLLRSQYGVGLTVAAISANMLVTAVLFWFSGALLRVLGRSGAKILSKVAALVLAAFAVMLVRKGVLGMLGL